MEVDGDAYVGVLEYAYLYNPDPPITDNWYVYPTGNTILLLGLALTSFKGVMDSIIFYEVNPLYYTLNMPVPLLYPLIFLFNLSNTNILFTLLPLSIFY